MNDGFDLDQFRILIFIKYRTLFNAKVCFSI